MNLFVYDRELRHERAKIEIFGDANFILIPLLQQK